MKTFNYLLGALLLGFSVLIGLNVSIKAFSQPVYTPLQQLCLDYPGKDCEWYLPR